MILRTEPLGLVKRMLEERRWMSLPAGKRREARDEQLRRVIDWCASTVPWYREAFAARLEQIRGVADLHLLPIVSKEILRSRYADFMPNAETVDQVLERFGASAVSTSGTSGERLTVLQVDELFAPLDLAGNEVLLDEGWSGRRLAIFTTPICSAAVCHMGKMPYEQRLELPTALTLNSSQRVLSIGRAEAQDIFADLHRYQPKALQVDPVYLVGLIRAARLYDLSFPATIRVVYSTYEYCSVVHRAVIEAALGAPVYDLYGSTELGIVLTACAEGRSHLWDSVQIAECLDDHGQPVAPGEIGAFTVTRLRAPVPMPLVRYRTGDLARAIVEPCSCSQKDREVFQVEGRVRDRILAPGGGFLTTRAIDELFAGLTFADHYQLTQRSMEEFELTVMRREGGDERGVDVIRDRLRERLGASARVDVRFVKEIAPARSLKYQLTRSTLLEA